MTSSTLALQDEYHQHRITESTRLMYDFPEQSGYEH